jgi:hypothetical protein
MEIMPKVSFFFAGTQMSISLGQQHCGVHCTLAHLNEHGRLKKSPCRVEEIIVFLNRMCGYTRIN